MAGPRLRIALVGLAALGLALALPGPVRAQEPQRLRVVGGLAGVSQFLRHEEPFWRDRLPAITGGRVTAEIVSSDRSGFPPAEMLALLQRGTVPFGTLLLAQAAVEEPELQALDLPLQNPDIATLRRTVAAYRPQLQSLLAERYGIELLAVYTYPAQVAWCRAPFQGLAGLAGRRIRISSLGQGEVFEALGAIPVAVPFAGIVPAMREGRVECAVTGAVSGNALGLPAVATQIQDMALSWGVSMFGANRQAWNALPEADRAAIRRGLSELEAAIWTGAEEETVEGMRCATAGTAPRAAPGAAAEADCAGGRGNLARVPMSEADAALRRGLLAWTVLPRWIDRCGPDCATIWDRSLGASLGIRLGAAANGGRADAR